MTFRGASPFILTVLLMQAACGDDAPPGDPCDPNPCFANVSCTASGENYTCGECPAGYEGDGETCTQTSDPCDDSPCFPGVTCSNQGASYSCGDCPAGYEGDGETCSDTDGCANNPCFDGVACTDVTAPGTGYACAACPAGYEGDGETCTDLDECADAPCFTGVTCTDVAAPGTGYTCDDCPAGYEGDGETCADIDGCATGSSTVTCFAGVECFDVAAPGDGFTCGDCPAGYEGDGLICTDIDGCAGDPCLDGSTCTDVAAPEDGFTCSPCVGATCPILRALAGADQAIISGTSATIMGDAVGYNGTFSCVWTNNLDSSQISTCTATVSPTTDALYTLTVTDASGATAQDSLRISVAGLIANAGPSQNIESTETATLSASWQGASCPNGSCVSCEWSLSDGTPVAQTCTATVSPTATSEYFLTVTDGGNNNTATDSTTVFVTDQPAQLCGWDVVVMTSQSYPTGANPNYLCDQTGTARRQTVNGKPAIVLSDLRVSNVRITGHISVETGSDDDHIGFMWGWQDPRNYYFFDWKQTNQAFGACGNALAGIAIKKVEGSTTASGGITFNPSFGFNATDYVYPCAMFWATARANEALLGDNSTFLLSPSDLGAFATGWRDFITYRVEFYYTPTRTKIVVYEDDVLGAEPIYVTEFVITDSSYPEGAFAFFSNSQEQVAFGDFILASLSDFAADAGADQLISTGASATLTGTADLAVPPYLCEWSEGSVLIGNSCDLVVNPTVDTTYGLLVTDAFGRVSSDDVTVLVGP